MGTQGYLVYRYKGRYLNRFVQNSAYPDSVGVDIACGIPVQREEFQRWLQAVRIKFEEEWARKVTEADKVFAYRLSTERLSNSPSALRVGSGQNWSSTSIHPPPAGFIVPREIEAVSDPGIAISCLATACDGAWWPYKQVLRANLKFLAKSDTKGIVYRIAFSAFHCAIVRI
ncbi:hypothetical protein BKA93DRAFT_329405 [Sparassis latifolia]